MLAAASMASFVGIRYIILIPFVKVVYYFLFYILIISNIFDFIAHKQLIVSDILLLHIR